MVEFRWRKLTAKFIKWEDEGQEVEGILSGHDQVHFEKGPVERWIVETTEGPIAFLGATVLSRMLEPLAMGTRIKVVYLGEDKTTKGQRVKLFDVFQAEPDEAPPVDNYSQLKQK